MYAAQEIFLSSKRSTTVEMLEKVRQKSASMPERERQSGRKQSRLLSCTERCSEVQSSGDAVVDPGWIDRTPRSTAVRNSLGGNVVQIVVTHGPEVTTDNGGIVGLGRVGDCVILAEENALLLERRERGRRRGIVVVGVLEPDLTG